MSRTPVFGALVALAVSGTLLGVTANGGDAAPTTGGSTVAAASAQSAGSADVISRALSAPRARAVAQPPATTRLPATPKVTAGAPARVAKGASAARPAAARIRTQRKWIVITLPFATRVTETNRYFEGQTKVLVQGRTGIRTKVIRVFKVNGHVVRRQVVSSRVTRTARTKVVVVGTRLRPISKSWRGGANIGRESVDRLNWRGLANCESHSNPRAGGHRGPYYGMYQFMRGTWRSVGGTGYPSDASAAEQTYRAKLLYVRSGGSPWPACRRFL